MESLITQLCEVQLEAEGGPAAFVKKAKLIGSQLADAKVVIPERAQVIFAMRHLPAKYALHRQVINKSSTSTFSDVYTALCSVAADGTADAARKLDMSAGASPAAFVARGAHGCSHCGRSNHTADICFDNPASSKYRPLRGSGEQQQMNQRHQSAVWQPHVNVVQETRGDPFYIPSHPGA